MVRRERQAVPAAGVHYFVGGATKLYGAALYRLRKEDFGELRTTTAVSPAWPIAYDELEPYYTRAEQLYQVHGARGEDPTEPPASAPVPASRRVARAADPAARRRPRGGRLPAVPRTVRDHARRGEPAVQRPASAAATCDGFPCLVHAKSDAEVLGVRPALEHPNVTLLTNAKVVRLETNGDGTAVTEVVVERRRRRGAVRRPTSSCVACGAANTAKLLLQSASDKHPNGLANGSDQVGRNYMFHDSTAVLALSREENHDRLSEDARAQRLLLRRTATSSTRSATSRWSASRRRRCSAASDRGRRSSRPSGRWSGWPAMRSTSGSRPRTCHGRRTASPSSRDGNIKLTYTETNAEPKKRLYAKVKSMLGKLDMNPGHLIHRFAYMKNDIPIAGCAHQAGTARFGTDPATSVLDVNCKAHELDNLYVVDTSVFPSIGAVNPALTAMANSLRVGDHLLERLK